jgi:hypothetical protein
MRIEVIADGKSHDRHEFIVQPRTGEIIELPTGKFVVDDFCHNITAGRLQVWCSPAGSQQKPRGEQQRGKNQPSERTVT